MNLISAEKFKRHVGGVDGRSVIVGDAEELVVRREREVEFVPRRQIGGQHFVPVAGSAAVDLPKGQPCLMLSCANACSEKRANPNRTPASSRSRRCMNCLPLLLWGKTISDDTQILQANYTGDGTGNLTRFRAPPGGLTGPSSDHNWCKLWTGDCPAFRRKRPSGVAGLPSHCERSRCDPSN